jgi:superfamily I DNA and/or RNA helicase
MKHLLQLQEHIKEGSVGVISPYRAQTELLKKKLRELPSVGVNTVDAFQGQERDVIYISLVRSNDRQEIGFLKDYRRMNVAMTRARKKLVMIGDSATFGSDNFYSRLLNYTEKRAQYRTAWEFADY